MNDVKLKERIINGLYGQAVCDAVGDPFEFKTNIDPKSVSNFAKKAARLNITDDSQMTLFGFEAVERMGRMRDDFEWKATQSFIQSYVDWFKTQTNAKPPFLGSALLNFPSLHVQRAPGNTCLESCLKLSRGEKVVNDSKGCGSVMRLLPVMMFHELEERDKAAIISAQLTHKHEENAQASRLWLEVANNCLRFNDTLRSTYTETFSSISGIGEGWTALECVMMAIYAVEKAKTFDELLEISIAHDGDSDSVGAVAGSLWGLAGREVPQEYIDKLVEIDAIKYCIDHYIRTP